MPHHLNLMDWSSQNVLAIGLGTYVYFWNASNNKVSLIFEQSYIIIFLLPSPQKKKKKNLMCFCCVIWGIVIVSTRSNGSERIHKY